MSTVILTMPRLGETMEEGKVTNWLVNIGASFARGDALIEFDTDKTAVEYPALGSGKLVNVFVKPGDVVKLGEPLAEIDLEGAENWVTAEEAAASESERNNDGVVIDLLMPRLGETMEEGKICRWLVEVGKDYQRGDDILEVETDKTIAEFPALESGKLVETLAEAGDVVKVGIPIARILVEKSVFNREIQGQNNEVKTPADPRQSSLSQSSVDIEENPSHKKAAHGQAFDSQPLRATPLARRYAEKNGVSLKDVRGSGRRGRIELVDVQRCQLNKTNNTGQAFSYWGPEQGVPVLMVHGFAGNRTTFEQLGKGLGRAGFRVKAIDLPGHGLHSDEADTFNDLVTSVSQELNSSHPMHIIAHSLGAAASIAAVDKSGGAASMTLIAPAGLGLKIDAQFIDGMAQATSIGTIRHFIERLSVRTLGFSTASVEAIYHELAKGRLRKLAKDICRDGYQAVNVRAELATISEQIPVRMICGMQDQILDYQESLNVSALVATHLFGQSGHMPHWDFPALVERIIIQEIMND